MKKIEIKDLIIGEVYFKNNFIFKHVNTNPYLCDNYAVYGLDNTYYHGNGHMKDYNKFPQRLATPEEKHWLETCIKADNFVSYEEALKTFIPEYVEAISNKHSSSEIIGTIYKTSELPKWVQGHKLEEYWKAYMFHYKPSTKEAYDAQFVVKEQLEEPKDKVLEKEGIDLNIGKIIRVESSEGAIYQLGDKITVFTKDSQNKGRVLTIKGFRWNNAKTNICAITELHSKNGIGLDKIELYSKPVVKELSLLEQAKLKYPIGTKIKSLYEGTICTITEHSHINYPNSDGYCKHTNSIWFTASPYSPLIYRKGQWAEIVDEFVLPENWYIKVTDDNKEVLQQYICNIHNLTMLTLSNINYVAYSKWLNGINQTENKLGYGLISKLNLNPLPNIYRTVTYYNGVEITFEQFKKHVLNEKI